MQHKQRGIAMIEVLGVLLIAAMLFKGISSMVDASMEDTKAQQTAQYQSRMVIAASKYLAANYTALAAPANVGVLKTVDFEQLRAAAVLAPGMREFNPYGQASCLLILPRSKVVAGPAPTTVTVLDALVVTEGTAAQAIPESVLAFAAANAGPGGGFISERTPALVKGTSGTWEIGAATTPALGNLTSASCSGRVMAAGSLASALFTDGPGLAADFLYRNKVPGMPELNRMNTPLALKTGLVDSAQVLAGTACSGAAIAVDRHKNLMHCGKDDLWQRVTAWKEPVGDHASLPLDPLTEDLEVGDVRMVNSLSRAFTYNGAKWIALAVDEHDNMNVPNNLTVGNSISGADLQVTGGVGAGTNITAGASVIAGTDVSAGQDVLAARDITAARNSRGKDLIADRDLTAGRDLRAEKGGAYLDHMQATSWAEAYSLTVYSRHNPGDKCHLPKRLETGELVYEYPIGTMVLDKPGKQAPVGMICTGTGTHDAVFVYYNGTRQR